MSLLGEGSNASNAGTGSSGSSAGSAGTGGSSGATTAPGVATTSTSTTTTAPGTSGTGGGAGTAAGTGTTTVTTSWRDTLPDDIKADPTLAKFSDVANLSKSYLELQRKIGEKGIIKPRENASPEEIRAFREQMGIPTGDKYTIEIKDVKFPQESLDFARTAGDKLGIEPKVMADLMKDFNTFEQGQLTAQAKAKEAATKTQIDGLRKEWGDGFDTNIQKAHFVAKELGGQEFIDHLNKTGLGNDVMMIKLLTKTAALMGEDKLREGNVGSGRPTNDELAIKIKQVQGQLVGLKQGDGRKAGLMAEFESLMRQSTGGR